MSLNIDDKQSGIKDIDVLLHPYLLEENEERSRQILAQLFAERIDPVVRHIIGYRLSSQSAKMNGGMPAQQINDLQSEVVVRLLTKLHDWKNGNIDHAIKDFLGYAAVIAHNTCSEISRRQNFQHSRLKDHIRYILNTQAEFALWQDDEIGWVGGFAIWRDQLSKLTVMTSSESSEKFVRSYLKAGKNHRKSMAERLALIFNTAGRPVLFTELINIVAELSGIDIRNSINGLVTTDPDVLQEAHPPTEKAGMEFEVEQRLYLQTLWREICKLPLPHRTALLLNLIDRDSGDRGLIISLADLRIATIAEIAACLNLPPEEFAAIWVDLPWDDMKIALHLGTTKRKVMRLRLSARKLLAKRMKELSRPSR
jgi:DNA-directed RNA polymerase specialized sigma24 family protein